MTELEKICRDHPELARRLAAELERMASEGPGTAAAKDGPGVAVELSLVFPIYNEEENIPELYRRITAVLDENKIKNAEILFVNDGSRDRSEEQIRDLRKQDPRVKLINFSRNFGHQAAITAGIDHSRGDATILMDADLQDPPHVIGEMLEKWRDGGEAKYTFKQSLRLAINGIVGFSSFPLRIAAFAGFLAFVAALVLLTVAIVAYFVDYHMERGWTSIVAIVLFIGGVQLILLGSIGEYIGRIYDEAKQRPNYIVREFLD